MSDLPVHSIIVVFLNEHQDDVRCYILDLRKIMQKRVDVYDVLQRGLAGEVLLLSDFPGGNTGELFNNLAYFRVPVDALCTGNDQLIVYWE